MKRPDQHTWHTLDIAEIKKDTGKAILVKLLVSGKEVWMPKSKIKIEGTKVTIPEWLKTEKGL